MSFRWIAWPLRCLSDLRAVATFAGGDLRRRLEVGAFSLMLAGLVSCDKAQPAKQDVAQTSAQTAAAAPAAAPVAPAPAAGNPAEEFCARKRESFTRYSVPWDDKANTLALPPEFPSLPADAVVCGTTPTMNQAFFYYKTDRAQKEVIDGFVQQLTAAGYKVDSTISDRLSFRVLSPDGKELATGGMVYHVGDVELVLTYRKTN